MLKIDTNCYFIKTSKLNKSSFKKHLGIRPRSYMSDIANKLFEYYYANSISLKKEYRKYYKKEFDTFRDFLFQKHNLFPSEIERLLYKRSYYKDLSITSDLNIDELMNDDTIRKAVISFDKEYTE